ncbi:MerR family transcriptional regulator [Neisseria sp. Ec49-e6-T10]|uniref:MerR family transcriptional regulator n=1 Tax=Neisseria sp. Ec49-e6-T10 TaxID=3140744 RepID=UPI003EBFC7A5
MTVILRVNSKSNCFLLEMNMYDSIGKFSERTGLSRYTLRYYEKENLIKPNRHKNGHRYYTEHDVNWVLFIKKLKDTNMPIKQIKQYALLRERGDITLEERMLLLQHHQRFVLETVANWQGHLNNLNEKIDFYRKKISSLR